MGGLEKTAAGTTARVWQVQAFAAEFVDGQE
jgi:hypothetical protein